MSTWLPLWVALFDWGVLTMVLGAVWAVLR